VVEFDFGTSFDFDNSLVACFEKYPFDPSVDPLYLPILIY
jgi:hypothetical protein